MKTAFLQITSTAIYTYYNASYDITLYHPAVSVVADASTETDEWDFGYFRGYSLPVSILILLATATAALLAITWCCCCCCGCECRECCECCECCDSGGGSYTLPSTPPRARLVRRAPIVPGPLQFAASIPSAASGCSGCSIESCSWMTDGRCCSCYDTRSKVRKEERIRDYCPPCRQHWGSSSLENCPDSWGLDQIQCSHGRKTACASVGRFEVSCCACKDSREGVLPLTIRLSSYCGPCSAYWRPRLGNSWATVDRHNVPNESTHTMRHLRKTADNGSLVDTKPRNGPLFLEEHQSLNTTAIKLPFQKSLTLRSGPTVITSSSEKVCKNLLTLRPRSVPLLENEWPENEWQREKVVARYEGKALYTIEEDAMESVNCPGRDVPSFNDTSPIHRSTSWLMNPSNRQPEHRIDSEIGPLTVAQLRRLRDREGKQYSEPTFLVPPLR